MGHMGFSFLVEKFKALKAAQTHGAVSTSVHVCADVWAGVFLPHLLFRCVLKCWGALLNDFYLVMRVVFCSGSRERVNVCEVSAGWLQLQIAAPSDSCSFR